ncbi:MAG: suppressor of loss of ypt1 [Peltula sp. TS41687]|nr:MAG: suppressor of loss of ypt1 [Peltula sp. TS41687]
MPHSVYGGDERPPSDGHWPSLSKLTSNHSDFHQPHEHFPRYDLDENRSGVQNATFQNGTVKDVWVDKRWPPRKENNINWGTNNFDGIGSKHGRQKSLTEAFKTIRDRRGSVSANAHELADALKAPVSMYCIIWYLTSALTNTSSKSIMNAFPRPVTLTLIQFAFVSSWCLLFSFLASVYPSLPRAIPALRHGIRYPSRDVLETTLPLAFFQVGGHLLSSTATSRIPVSLVHTIKGLSPLFTVFAYRFFFRIHHTLATYLSLIPLTFGVMLACSAEFSGNLFGVLCAFGGAIIFVTQNIFSKKLFNEAARAEADGHQQTSRKLDKLNLLCYSSGLAFVLTSPLWLWSEGFMLLGDFFHDGALDLSGKKDALAPGRLALEFLFNGTFHFGQNIMAFVLLSMVSPVTYSVASLIKRIFVITVAIVWFGNKTTRVQGVGIALTFIGLYLYDRTSDAAKADRRAKLNQIKTHGTLLPLSELPHIAASPPSLSSTSGQLYGGANGFVNGLSGMNGTSTDEKPMGSVGRGVMAAARDSTNLARGICLMKIYGDILQKEDRIYGVYGVFRRFYSQM